MKTELTIAIKALAVKVTGTTNGYDAAQYAQAVEHLVQALHSIIYAERHRESEPVGEVIPEGGTD